MTEQELNINEIVRIETMPKIFSQLEQIGLYIDENIKDLETLECNEDNKQEVKKRRTEINNTLKLLEDKRKSIKNAILEPYKAFEDKYVLECKDKLENASDLLKKKIDYIEDYQRAEKYQELLDFFFQYRETYHLDFIEFQDLGLNITLSASMKSLKDQIKDFCERVDKDIQLIQNDENKDKLMLEYRRNGFDYQKAKLTLIEEQKQLEELKKKMEQKQELEKQEEEVVEQVQKVIAPIEIISDEELLEVTFTVKCSKEKIRLLKRYLSDNEIEVIE